MDEQEQRIRMLEAEMLAMMGVMGEVFRRLARIDAQHHAAVRDGFDEAIRILSQARNNAANAAMRNGLDYALKSVEWLTLTALAPSEGGKAHATVQ